jgi:hypothetical protein
MSPQLLTLTRQRLAVRRVAHVRFVLAFALTTQFRGIHFFCVHRTMHPWKRPYGPKNGLKNGALPEKIKKRRKDATKRTKESMGTFRALHFQRSFRGNSDAIWSLVW